MRDCRLTGLKRKESVVTLVAKDVQALFNGKARLWRKKYGPGGKLNSRVEQFTARVRDLVPPPGKILDLGCGTGEIAAAISRMGYEITACDIAEGMLEIAESNRTAGPVKWVLLRPGWTTLPFKNGSFDVIVASSVFEYLVDAQGVARELSRVLRPEGILIFSVPNPSNRIRKVEELLRSGFLSRALPPLFGGTPGVKAYLTYLRLSRNRFGPAKWKSILNAAGFETVDRQDFSEQTWSEQSGAPLILLTVKKVTISQAQLS